MAESFIPIAIARDTRVPRAPEGIAAANGWLADTLGRPLRDLRISVTDRCNFRCTYCMPREVFGPDHAFLPHRELLTFEEIERIAKAFIAHGVDKIRLTGGEPLLRKDLDRLIALLAPLRTHDGRELDITLTTNASILAKKARALAAAGLKRVTVSLDALDDRIFRAMTDADYGVSDVLAGIDAAAEAGLAPIKINMVVQRAVNEDQIVPMAQRFRGTGHVLRFIEFMDVGHSNGWRLDDVVPSAELLGKIDAVFPIEPLERHSAGEVAQRWRYRDGAGEIGAISSVTQAFCRDCTRARLSTDGRLYLCLFATEGHDLRALVRGGVGERDLENAIAHIWHGRTDRYSELRGSSTPELAALPKIEMSYIGG